MLISKREVKNILVRPSDLGSVGSLASDQLASYFDACSKKTRDVVSIRVDDSETTVVVNNAGSECVAQCAYTVVFHEPEIGETVCGSAEKVGSHLVVCVSKHFKVFVKHPNDFETKRVHVKLTGIKSERSSAIIALGVQVNSSDDALRCECPPPNSNPVCA